MSQDEHEKEGLCQKDENLQSHLKLSDKPIMPKLIIECDKEATNFFLNTKKEQGKTLTLKNMKSTTGILIKRTTINLDYNLHSEITKILIDEVSNTKKSESLNETSLNTSVD